MILERRGLLQSHPSRSAYRTSAEEHDDIAAALAAGPKGSADLTSYLGARTDQGRSSTCFYHSKASCQYGAAALAGAPLLFFPSPLVGASCTFAMVRAAATPPDQELPELKDTGAALEDAAAVDKWGVARIGVQIAGRDGVSDVPDDKPGVAFPEVDESQIIKAASTIMTGEYKITVNDRAPLLLCATLDARVLAWNGFFCDSRFEALKPGEVAGVPDESDPLGGGHATLYAGYRIVPRNGIKKIEGLKVNSWGKSWCEAGCVWVSEEHVMAEWEIWPFAARRVA